MLIAAAIALQAVAPGAASAQNAVTPAPPANATDVGPPQLRDFSLNGTVTRPAETQAPRPAPARPAPATQATPAQPSSTTSLPPARLPSARAPEPVEGSATVELPPPSPSAALPPAGEAQLDVPPAPEPAATFAPEAMPDGPSILPWLLAAVLLGGGAAYYFLRLRPRSQVAAGFALAQFTAPRPEPAQPETQPPAPEARPKAALPTGGAIVSTSLRPWIEVDFLPERTIIEDDTIAIEFTVALYNSGSAPARDVLIEAAMFNASAAQDRLIGAFFSTPAGRGVRIELVAPLQRVVARSSVTVARAEVRPLHADGRPLLVPMTAINILYRWGSNNHGQTSASHLVGKETTGEKLAPFRLDLGPRVFRGLAAREHQLKVRK